MPKRDFLAITDFNRSEIQRLFDLAAQMKEGLYGEKPLAGKALAMVFAKSSTRTRVAFEVGTTQLGGHELFLSAKGITVGPGEPEGDRRGRRRQQPGQQVAGGRRGSGVRGAAGVTGRVRGQSRESRARQEESENRGERGAGGSGRGRARREHRRVGLDGAGRRSGGAAQRVQGLYRGRGSHEARRPQGDLPALPPGAPRAGSDRRGDRRAAVARV